MCARALPMRRGRSLRLAPSLLCERARFPWMRDENVIITPRGARVRVFIVLVVVVVPSGRSLKKLRLSHSQTDCLQSFC